jgi:hypothetical protein
LIQAAVASAGGLVRRDLREGAGAIPEPDFKAISVTVQPDDGAPPAALTDQGKTLDVPAALT